MPERPHKVTPESARLGRELRALRTLVKLSQQDIADALDVSKSTVQRIESGEQRPSRVQVSTWAAFTKASDEVARRVVAMAEVTHGATWSDILAAEPVQHLQGIAARRDESAQVIRSWSPSIIPGLLQTPAYALALLRLMDPTGGSMDVAGAARARMERQDILYKGGRQFQFVLGEEALRRPPSVGVMAGQLAHLAQVATLDDVDLAVIPLRQEGVPGWPGFVYREPHGDGPPYVTVELPDAGPVIDAPDRVESYRRAWAQLWLVAVHGDDALDLIREVRP